MGTYDLRKTLCVLFTCTLVIHPRQFQEFPSPDVHQTLVPQQEQRGEDQGCVCSLLSCCSSQPRVLMWKLMATEVMPVWTALVEERAQHWFCCLCIGGIISAGRKGTSWSVTPSAAAAESARDTELQLLNWLTINKLHFWGFFIIINSSSAWTFWSAWKSLQDSCTQMLFWSGAWSL